MNTVGLVLVIMGGLLVYWTIIEPKDARAARPAVVTDARKVIPGVSVIGFDQTGKPIIAGEFAGPVLP